MATDQNLDQTTKKEKVVRLVRPSVVVLCGPAGCGKSTFAASHFRPTQVISSDQCRAVVCDDEQDQRFQPQAFTLLHFIVEQRLGLNRLCVIDSTALTQSARRSLLELARKYRVPCVILSFEVPLETCIARDEARAGQPQGRAVGRAVIERHYKLFEEAKYTLAREGFDRIESLSDEDLQNVRFEIVFRPAPRVNTTSTRRAASLHHEPGQTKSPAAHTAGGPDAPPPRLGQSVAEAAAQKDTSANPNQGSARPAAAPAGSNSKPQTNAAAASAGMLSPAGSAADERANRTESDNTEKDDPSPPTRK